MLSLFRLLPPKTLAALVLLGVPCASFAQPTAPYTLTEGLTTGRIAHVVVTGSKHLSIPEILSHITEAAGSVYDRAAAARDQAALMATGLFQQAQVTPTPTSTGRVDLTVAVSENPVIQAITFIADTPGGRLPIPAEILRARMQTKVGQTLSTVALTHDLDVLFNNETGYARSQGFLVNVSNSINIEPTTGVLTIPLVVSRVARIDVLGGRRAAAEVRQGLRVKVDDVLNLNALRQDLMQMQGHGAVAQDSDFSVWTVAIGQALLVIRVVEKPEGTPNPSFAVPWLTLPNRWAGAVIPVQINGTETASFVLNTLTPLSGISPELAARLHLTPHAWTVNGQPVTVEGQPVTVEGQPGQVVTLARMRFGSGPGVIATEEQMPLYNTKSLSAQLGRPIDGVLGVSDLGAQAVSLDWDTRQVRFWERGNLSAAERQAAGFGNALALPLAASGINSLLFTIDAKLTESVGARPQTLGLATASNVNYLSASEAKALGATPYNDTSTPPTPYARLKQLTIGSLSTHDLAFALGDDSPAMLGLNFLSRYRVLLDYAAGMVYLQPVVRVSGAANSSVVPFAYDPVTTRVPIIEASLDGGPPMRFAFDTGFSNALTLNKRVARRLDLNLNSDRHEIFNSSLPSASAPVHQLVLRGRTKADNLTVDLARAEVADMRLVSDMTAGRPVAGVIGSEILRNTAVRFDYRARTLTFFTKSLSGAIPAGATVLPITEIINDDAYFINQASAPSTTVPLLVDSGSVITHLPLATLPSLHPDCIHIGGATMLSSMSLVENIHLPHFELGTLSVADTVVSVAPTEMSDTAWAPGTLGENILSRYRVTLDPPHSRLILEPPATPNFNYGWVGLFLHKAGGGIQVSKVQPGTPAARAGVKAGDRILRIDGRSLQNTDPMLAQTLADGAAGTVGVFQLQRGTAPMRTVRLARLAEAHIDPPALDGLIGRRDQAHPLVIKAVLPGSAAKSAGIHAGDSITTINGMVTATMTNAQWQDILYEPRLALTVRAAGSPAVRTLVLQGHAPVSPHQTPLQGTAAPAR